MSSRPVSVPSLPLSHVDQLGHRLLRIILLDYFLVVLRMFELDMLIETALGAITLGAVFDRALVVSSDLGGSSPMSLFLFIVNFKWHV